MATRLDTELHENYLLAVLKDIYRNPLLASELVFKGGTALYFFYELNRFSVDLDFDLVDRNKEELVFNELRTIVIKHGELKDDAIKRFGILMAISYSKGLHRLKIDVSNRSSNAGYQLKQHLGISMNVMLLEDMAANKLLALTDRKKPANRDLFDCHFLLKNHFKFNEAVIKARTGLSLAEQLQRALDFVESYDDKYILDGLGELVDADQKAWIKNNLKTDLLFYLKLALKSARKA